MAVKLTEVIAPSFYPLHHDIAEGRHTHYWLAGGRGSTKSSLVSIEIVLSLTADAVAGRQTHALVLRRYSNTLRESVYAQIQWAINVLGMADLWRASVSPMRFTYIPSGQSILFRGVDDATKIKSVKVDRGYIKYAWFEEANEFENAEKIRNV